MEPKAEQNQFTVVTNPSPDEVTSIRAGLYSYNRIKAGEDGFAPVTLVLRDENGVVVGGLLGATYWCWLVVEILWIAEAARHQGLGSQLLCQAERIAIERGCHSAHLDTMSFQAPGFYEKHGYRIFGVIDDLPMGHKRIYFTKRLIVPPDL